MATMEKKSRTPSKNSTPAGTPTKKAKGQARSKPAGKSATKSAAKPVAKPVAKPASLSPIPRERILKSIEQLTKFENVEDESKGASLLDDEDELNKLVQLIIVNNKSFTGSNKSFKLKLANIKHSIFKPWNNSSVTSIKNFKILLILKDSDVKKVSQDDLVIKDGAESITPDVEIICGKDLKTNYKAFERRRAFISEFSLILADDNIITTLPKLLGGKAYNKLETTPIGIRAYSNKQFSLKTLINNFEKTYLNKLPIKLPRGTTLNVHLGNLEWFNANEFADNIELILKDFIDQYKIRSVFIKCNNSPVLPLYYNQDVLEELTSKSSEKEAGKELELIEIDGVQVHLSTFDKALMEIANPDELKTIFAKNINSAKRQRSDEQESETIKKAKN